MVLLADRHRNKQQTGLIKDPVAHGILSNAEKKQEDRLTQISQAGSSSSNDLPHNEVNRSVLEVNYHVLFHFDLNYLCFFTNH